VDGVVWAALQVLEVRGVTGEVQAVVVKVEVEAKPSQDKSLPQIRKAIRARRQRQSHLQAIPALRAIVDPAAKTVVAAATEQRRAITTTCLMLPKAA
jgi:hypothetical protein